MNQQQIIMFLDGRKSFLFSHLNQSFLLYLDVVILYLVKKLLKPILKMGKISKNFFELLFQPSKTNDVVKDYVVKIPIFLFFSLDRTICSVSFCISFVYSIKEIRVILHVKHKSIFEEFLPHYNQTNSSMHK
jgi:hypothetical protein